MSLIRHVAIQTEEEVTIFKEMTSIHTQTDLDWKSFKLVNDVQGPEFIDYNVKDAKEPLTEWLKKYQPTNIYKKNGTEWIRIQGKSFNENDYKPNDEYTLQTQFDYYVRKKAICVNIIQELAETYGIVSGKWLFHVSAEIDIEKIWNRIAMKIAEDEFCGLCNYAKISSSSNESTTHVICLYIRDYTNEARVFALERAIRQIGILETLRFKPDIYSFCGVYSNNNYNIRPVVFVSEFDSVTGKTEIIEPKVKIRKAFWM